MRSKQKNYPKISVIIPSYNQGNYIEETILSIINQNYPNLELIIIDGNSDDNTVEIIKKYDDNISYWVSERDRGQSHAINKGFARATGDILGWINSDDYYLPGYLHTVASAFMNTSNLDIVYGNSITLDERDGKTYKEYGKLIRKSFLVFGGIVSSHTAFWRKSIHVPIDENIECAMDYELWIRLFPGHKWRHLNSFGGVFRLQAESKSMGMDSRFEAKWKRDMDYIFNKHKFDKPGLLLHRFYRYTNAFYKKYCETEIAVRRLFNTGQ